MVLASQFQVSDEEIRDYVRNVAWQNSSIHKFPSLLNPGEVLPKGYRRPSDTAIFKARRGTFKKVKIVPKLIGGGIRAGGLDRTTSIPTRLGKRHASADDDEISVNVFLPFTGDILKMSVSQNLSISGPSTPRNITESRFHQFWGKNADRMGYTTGRLDDMRSKSQRRADITSIDQEYPSLKTEIQRITRLPREHIRLVHPQSKQVFRGVKTLADYGIFHGQTILLVDIKPKSVAAEVLNLPTLRERLDAAKFVPRLTSSLKKRGGVQASPELVTWAHENTAHRIMPAPQMNVGTGTGR